LRRTLESLDIKPIGGTEAVDLIRLSAEDARELQQPEGEPFLGTTRTVHDLTGSVVEHVRSLLHPAHFTLQLSFGDPQP
jgi:GntR family transcriptional regulator